MADTPITDKGNMEALLKIGAQMANVMFNLAQRPGEPLTGDIVSTMDSLRKQWDAARRTPAPAPELPALPTNVANVTRRIRRCESDVPAQVVLEHFATEYAQAAIAADRLARGVPAKAVTTLTAAQIAAGAAVLGDDGKPIGRNTAIMVADAMHLPAVPAQQPESGECDA